MLLKGARQVGKISAIREYAKRHEINLIEINFYEDDSARSLFSGAQSAKDVLLLSMTRPVKELKAFRKVHLKAGETVEVGFEITPEMLSWYYVDPFETGAPQLALEPGDFEIMVGPDSSTLQTLMLNISE